MGVRALALVALLLALAAGHADRSRRARAARAGLLAGDQGGQRDRGVGLSPRLAAVLRRGPRRRHHAVPGDPLTESRRTMIQSELVVTKQTPLAPRGLVVAEHPLGARVGATILEDGGNAVDAAVATAFAMTVVEPFMSTLAGSGPMPVHLAKRGETVAIDFNGQAPARADATMFRLIDGISDGLFAWPRVEHAANEYGHRSVAVPGSVAGLALALERYGTMAWADALEPAIALARDGFVPDWYQALTTARSLEELGAFPETARVYLRNGRAIHRPRPLG